MSVKAKGEDTSNRHRNDGPVPPDEELTEHKVRQVNTTSTSPIQELQLKYDAMDARMGNTEKHIRSKKSDISSIIRSLSSSNRDRER